MRDLPPVIDLHNVSHRYGDGAKTSTDALRGVTLRVERGQFVSVVGPSGCGKTTLLSLVAGLSRPYAGNVKVHGAEVVGIQPGLMGYMFARDSLLPWRTVKGNVALGLEFDRSSRDIDNRVSQLVKLVGLSGWDSRYPHELSHGMRQRVALARTLARDPEILLMDEPFSALDAQTRVMVQQAFLHIWESTRKTVVFVTHDINEALLLSDRIIVITGKPGTISAVHDISFSRPREVESLQGSPEFQGLYWKIWKELGYKQDEAGDDGEHC